MRPDKDEMLASVRRALVEFVGPEVTSVYGRTQLAYAVNLLAAISRESDDAVANLVQENADLRKLLRHAARRLPGNSLTDAALLADLATFELAPRKPDLRLSALRSESSLLFDLFVRLQAACEDCLAGDPAVEAVYRKTLTFLRGRSDSQLGLRGG